VIARSGAHSVDRHLLGKRLTGQRLDLFPASSHTSTSVVENVADLLGRTLVRLGGADGACDKDRGE